MIQFWFPVVKLKSFATVRAMLSLMVAGCVWTLAGSELTQAQMPLGVFPAPAYPAPVYPAYAAPVAVVSVQARHHRHCRNCVQTVPIQATYAAYYAPQVPVVPMAAVPVPTVSAYYVPTVPVAQPYYAVPVATVRVRRHSATFYPAAVYPVYPSYWAPY